MEIRLLLEKYKNLGFSEKKIKEITLHVCEEFSLVLAMDDVVIKNTEIRINVSGAARTHFVLLKKKIEDALLERFKEEGINVSKIY